MPAFSKINPYNRENAIAYALYWALKRNPRYFDYSNLGGDCTNFASQVIYAGAEIMNFTPTFGWYYKNANDKSPSWTGVNFLYDFLTINHDRGPFAEEVNFMNILPGDIIQLSFSGGNSYQHSLVVTALNQPVSLDQIYISTHSTNALNERLTSYTWASIRFLHIKGVYV